MDRVHANSGCICLQLQDISQFFCLGCNDLRSKMTKREANDLAYVFHFVECRTEQIKQMRLHRWLFAKPLISRTLSHPRQMLTASGTLAGLSGQGHTIICVKLRFCTGRFKRGITFPCSYIISSKHPNRLDMIDLIISVTKHLYVPDYFIGLWHMGSIWRSQHRIQPKLHKIGALDVDSARQLIGGPLQSF